MATEAAVRKLAGWIIGACVVALGVTTALVVSPALRSAIGLGADVASPAYAVGERVDVDPAIYNTSDRTVLLFARSTCGVCLREVPFFADVFVAGQQHGATVAMVTPSSDLDAEGAFAEQMGLTRHQVHHAGSGSIRLRAVPTLMVVDRTGAIDHVWFGLSDATTQAEILGVLAATSARYP